MKGIRKWAVLAIAGATVIAAGPSSAEPYVTAGIDLGATGALSPMERFVSNGATLAPRASYMLNRFLGVMGQFHIVGIPNKDRREPDGTNIIDSDATWILGATVGPRISLPLGGLEIYGTWQIGGFTGLAPHSAVTGASWGYSAGGGANLAFGKNFSVGGFGRFNRLGQRAHDAGDVRYATGGISVTFRLPQGE